MHHHWLRWFNGYLTIVVKGKRLERLINLAVQRKMQIWAISRFDQEKAKMAINLEDFFHLKPLLKETGCRVRILRKHGLPFFLTRVRARYAFVGGFVAFVSLLFALSNMIWSIEVVGTDKIAKQEILMIANEIGIKQGKFTFFLDDPQDIQTKLMEKLPQASWIGFQLKGTKAQIRVVEKVIPEEKEKLSPRSLVATKSAIIHQVFATKGRPMVKVNDLVKKGDLLISGFIGKEDQPIAVAAQGKVEGEVWYETEVAVPLVRTQAVYTGEKHRNIYLLIGNAQIKIWGYGEKTFAEYETKEESWLLKWKDYMLPIGWKKEVLHSMEIKKIKVNSYEAQQIAREAAKKDLLSKMENNGYVKEEKVLHQAQENDKVYIKMHMITIEDIAAEEPIILEGD